MKKLAIAAIVGVIAAITLSSCSSSPAPRGDAVHFSFDVGNVRLAYVDGYWDSNHRWHNWSNKREARDFRKHHRDRYVADRHTRYQNEGWRDSDNDGIPNRLDSHPNNRKRD
jgi:hypothetical protein